MNRAAILAALVGLTTGNAALAHGIWLAERHGEMTLVYGHGADDDPYDPNKLTEIRAFDTGGKEVPVDVQTHEQHATLKLPKDAAVVTVAFDNGFWTERQDGSWVNQSKAEVADAKTAGHYLKGNVSILASHSDLGTLPAAPLQIVPLVDPGQLHAGDELPIRVLYEGKPLAGAEIIADYVNLSDEITTTTDEKGEAKVTLRNQGLNVLATKEERVLGDNSDADIRQHFATLSFMLRHEGE